MLDILKRLHEIFPSFKLEQDGRTGLWSIEYVPETVVEGKVSPAFNMWTDGKEYFEAYFDDGDLYVNGFSSEEDDHPWELSQIVKEVRYILRIYD
jgi:hypothetical protein